MKQQKSWYVIQMRRLKWPVIPTARVTTNTIWACPQRRAQAVTDYLIANGANAANIFVKGYGETEPVADNGTKEGRAANRRVELRH